MSVRKLLVRLLGPALMLAVAGWFGALSAWNAARIWKPYDQRLSFSGSRLVSQEFEINTESSYGIHLFCPEYYGRQSNTDTYQEWTWEVLEGGRIVAKGHVLPCDFDSGGFRGHTGRYVLVLEPIQGVTGWARVSIEECGDLGAATRFWLAFSGDLLVLIVTINLGVLVRSIIVTRLDARDAVARAASLTQPGSLGPAPRINHAIRHPWNLNARPRPDFTRLSWYAYILFTVVFVADVGFGVVLTSLAHAEGFPIRLLRPGIQGASVPRLEPLVVRIEQGLNGGPWPPPDRQSMSMEQIRLWERSDDHILYFNSQRVSWDQLGPLLDKELMRRPPDWPVYVRGDGDLEWHSVARAVDIIRGKGAQVVLLTDWGKPKSK